MSVCITTSGFQMAYVPPPGPPLNLSATPNNPNQITLNWSAAATQPGTSIAQYIVYRNSQGNFPPVGTVTASTASPTAPDPVMAALNATGTGTRYDVHTPAQMDTTPWATLGPGDVVNIFNDDLTGANPTTYPRKFGLRGQGTAANPITINGVTDANGIRPIIGGTAVSTCPSCNPSGGFSGATDIFHSTTTFNVLGMLSVLHGAKDDPNSYVPKYINIQNLGFTGSQPNNTFTDIFSSTPQNWGNTAANASAGIYLLRGDHITTQNCAIYDNSYGLFFQCKGDGDINDVPNILIEAVTNCSVINNKIYGNGLPNGNQSVHNLYIQGGPHIIEGNYIGSVRVGSGGSSLKIRSANIIIRYNYIVNGNTRAIDMVHTETNNLVRSIAGYGSAYVYGNVVLNDFNLPNGGGTRPIHFGCDNTGEDDPNIPSGQTGSSHVTLTPWTVNGFWDSSTAGVGNFIQPQLQLYFYENTCIHRSAGSTFTHIALIQPSLTSTLVDIRDNIFVMDGAGMHASWLQYCGRLHVRGNNLLQYLNQAPPLLNVDYNWDPLGAAQPGLDVNGGNWYTVAFDNPPIVGSPNFTNYAANDFTLAANSAALGQAQGNFGSMTFPPTAGFYAPSGASQVQSSFTNPSTLPPTKQFRLNNQTVSRTTTNDLGAFQFGIVSSGSALTFSDTNLTPGTAYTYYVKAIDSRGAVSIASVQASATTLVLALPPAAPTNLAVTAVTTNSVSLSWSAVTGATTYNLYRNGAKVQTGLTATSATDTGLNSGTAYTYTVTAQNTAGEGAASNSAQGTTAANTVKKWAATGWWMGSNAVLQNGRAYTDPHFTGEISDLSASASAGHAVHGYRVFVTYAHIDPNNANGVDANYHWADMDGFKSQLQAMNPPQKFAIQFNCGVFNSGTQAAPSTGDFSAVPQFMLTNPGIYGAGLGGSAGNGYGGYYVQNTGGYNANITNANVQAQIIKCIQAIARRYDNDPAFAVFVLEEDSVQVPNPSSGVQGLFEAAFQAIALAAAQAFVKTPVAIQATFQVTQQASADTATFIINNGMSPGSADTFGIAYQGNPPAHFSWGLASAAGIQFGPTGISDRRPITRWILDFQSGDIAHTTSIADLTAALNQEYDCAMLFFCHQTGLAAPNTWANWANAAPQFASNSLTNTTYAPNFPQAPPTQGTTWKQLTLPAALANGKVNKVFAAHDGYLYAGGGTGGVFRASVSALVANPTNSGAWQDLTATWPKSGGVPLDVTYWAEDPNGNILAAAGIDNVNTTSAVSVIAKLNSSTLNWTVSNLYGPKYEGRGIDFDATGAIWVAGQQNGIFKSTDGGATFNVVVADPYGHFGQTTGFVYGLSVIGGRVYWGGEGALNSTTLDFASNRIETAGAGYGLNQYHVASNGTQSTAATEIYNVGRQDASGYIAQHFSGGAWADSQAAVSQFWQVHVVVKGAGAHEYYYSGKHGGVGGVAGTTDGVNWALVGAGLPSGEGGNIDWLTVSPLSNNLFVTFETSSAYGGEIWML